MTPTCSSTRCVSFLALCVLGLLASFVAVQLTRAAEDQGAPKLRVLILSGLNNPDFLTTDELYHNMVPLTDHPRQGRRCALR